MGPIGDLDGPSARKPDAMDAAESPQAEGADSAEETQVSREQLIAMAEAVGLDADLLDSMLDALDGDAQTAAEMLEMRGELRGMLQEKQAANGSPQFQGLSCNGSFAVSNPVEGVSQAPNPRPARRFGRLRNALRRGAAAEDTRE